MTNFDEKYISFKRFECSLLYIQQEDYRAKVWLQVYLNLN